MQWLHPFGRRKLAGVRNERSPHMYVVAGVTGNTGKVVANRLLDRGEAVRVIVRDTAKAASFAARGAEVAVADLTDAAALSRAFTGARGAYVLLPPSPASKAFRALQDATSAAIASALGAASVPHAVLLSSIGAELPSGTGPIAGLHVAEARLSELPSTRATFLRAGYFAENVAGSLGALDQGIFPTFLPASLPIDAIATVDIGDLAASLLLEGPRAGVVNLGGPTVTTNEIAATASRILGKPLTVVEAPLDAVVPTLTSYGMSDDMAGLYREMLEAFGAGRLKWQDEHKRLQGKTSMEVVLRGLLGK
jgi:uncharacterized protein YbjT (DUF2867 family)